MQTLAARIDELKTWLKSLTAHRHVLVQKAVKLMADKESLEYDMQAAQDELERLEAMTPDEFQREQESDELQYDATLAACAARLRYRKRSRKEGAEREGKCRRPDGPPIEEPRDDATQGDDAKRPEAAQGAQEAKTRAHSRRRRRR